MNLGLLSLAVMNQLCAFQLVAPSRVEFGNGCNLLPSANPEAPTKRRKQRLILQDIFQEEFCFHILFGLS